MTAPRVRPATPADAPAWLDLIDALADYERLPRPAADARERLVADAFGPAPRIRVLIGEDGDVPAGYAIWFHTYSSFLARPTMYLEDLFVRPESRGRGLGRALFRAVAEEAVRGGCGRMEWAVLDWNRPAIDFYERAGARRLGEWLSYRLEGEALARAASAGR